MSRCRIWGTPAIYEENRGVSIICDSPRAGGRYWIGNQAVEVLKYKDEAFKIRLTSWLVDQRKEGVDCPKVYAQYFDSISERNRLSMPTRGLNLLVYISRQLPDEAELFEYEIQVESEDYFDDQRRSLIVRHWEMLTESESREPEHVCTLLDYLVDKGCLEKVRAGATLLKYRITANGWAVLESPSPPTRKIGFTPS